MIWKQPVLTTPAENILYDEVLLSLADQGKGGEALRVWESPELFVVLGRTGKAGDDVKAADARRDRVPVLRRFSGGGTVLQGPGCLNYSLIISKDRDPALNDLRKSYAWILGKVIAALGRSGVRAVFRPISDLAVPDGEKKFSGNAQHRGRRFILHHGTILYAFDLEKIERYLAIPREVPEYRRKRGHLDFVVNVPLDPVVFRQALCEEFSVIGVDVEWPPEERQALAEACAGRAVAVDLPDETRDPSPGRR